MKVLYCLLFISKICTFFYFKVDKTERCLIYKTKKDSELLVTLKLQTFEQNKNATILLLIKNENTEYHNIKRYLMKNKTSQTFVYHSISDREFFVCISSKEQTFLVLKIKPHQSENKKILSKEQFSLVENKIKNSIFKFGDLKTFFDENKIESLAILKVF